MNTSFKEHFESHLLSAFQSSLDHLTRFSPALNSCWKDIANAWIYPLEAGGKRVRPMIVGLTAEACGAAIEHKAILQAACAVELIHTYSLVHDDLPCMDNDDFRRGQPTTHKVFGEANALLVGDALLTHAFTLLSELPLLGVHPEKALMCVQILSQCSGPQGMIAGQWLDLCFEKSKHSGDWESLQAIHSLKTGALLSAAFSIGLVIGSSVSSLPTLRALTQSELGQICKRTDSIGVQVGLVFQIIDDILDVTRSSLELGKTAGKDSAQDKLTAVRLLGLEGSSSRAAQLTEECLNELDALQTQLCEKAGLETNAINFRRLRHFIAELLSRTS